jgi:hypothetical protein
MPTANPRISITLTPAVAAVMRELSAVTGNSQSAIVAELLETSLPVFERVVKVLRAAETAQIAVKQEMAAGLDRAQTRLEEQMGLQLAEMDGLTKPLLEHAEKIARRGGGGARSVASTRPAPLPEVVKVAKKGLVTPVAVTRGSGTKSRQSAPKRGGS